MALASLEELTGRLEWDLDEKETRAALGALEDLSEQAIYYGKAWTTLTVPRLVKNTILAAAARYMRNPDGYLTSKAGDEALSWTDRGQESGSAFFTDREIEMIRGHAARTGLWSAPVTVWGPTRKAHLDGYVPVVTDGREKPFPFFADDYT